MINIFLAIDFGSTYTKLTAIDLNNKKVIATTKSLTTIKTDVLSGYNTAFEALKKILDEKVGLENIEFKYKKACSSAAGGLKIIAIGLVPDLTTEAAKKAALSSGARVISTYAFELTKDNINEMKKTPFDILLLSGGTNGGNSEYILKNAQKLVDAQIKVPVIVAGNEDVREEISELFKKSSMEYYITENVMPVVNKINVEPVREIIRQVFIKNITKAKGMENVEKNLGEIIMPTPSAVLSAAELLANEVGDVMIIDIGGATTDVHSVGKGLPKKRDIQLKGMEEPYAKRTVEGDLGMRYSAMSLYEATSLNKIRNFLGSKDSKINIRENFKFRQNNPEFISKSKDDIIFDEMMAMICTEISVSRHIGMLECIYSPMGTIFIQTGKDLTDTKYLIGTGGVLVNSNNPKNILELAMYNDEDPRMLKPKFPTLLLDKAYVLSAMGLLARDFPEIALEILKKELVEV